MTGEDTPMTAREETAKEKYVELVTARKRKSMEDQGYRWFPDKQGGTWRDALGRIVEKILSPAAGKKQKEMMDAAHPREIEKREAEAGITEATPYGLCKGCGVARESYQNEENLRRTNEEIHCDVCGMNPRTGEKPKIITGDPEGLYLVSEARIKANSRGTNMGPPKSRFSSFNAPNTPKGPYDAPDNLYIPGTGGMTPHPMLV